MIAELTNETLAIAAAPAIAGLRFRRFRGPADYPHMVAVLEASKVADAIEEVDSVEKVANSYAHLTNCDPYQDMVFVHIEDEVVGYCRTTWWQEAGGDRIYTLFGFLKPQWRGRGIGRALLRHNEAHLRRIAAAHPLDGRRYFDSFADDQQVHLNHLLQSEGYQPVRYFYLMVRPDLEAIPDLPLPDGLEIRPVLPEHYATILAANHEAFRDHWGFSEHHEPSLAEWLGQLNFDPTLWRVAWEADQVAGMVLGFIDRAENERFNRLRGWTEEIAVRRPWRRRGLARAVLAASLRALKERGMAEAALGVDTENLTGARRLYESMGFRPVRRSTAYRKEMT